MEKSGGRARGSKGKYGYNDFNGFSGDMDVQLIEIGAVSCDEVKKNWSGSFPSAQWLT